MNILNNSYSECNQKTSFKAGAPVLNAAGSFMQAMENGGFLASFLVQDGIGMTLPRTYAGFNRDKEVTGQYNMQEGFEVLGREGLTGPIMMAVAPLGLAVASAFGRSTSINSRLIERFGDSLKEFIADSNFDKNLLNNSEKFRTEFYKYNINNILSDTLGAKNVKEKDVDYIMKQLENYNNIPKDAKLSKFRGKAKYKSECINNISKYIDNLRYETSDDLANLQKIKVGSPKLENKKMFSTHKAIDGLIKYTDDAVSANKNLAKIDALKAENIKNNAITRRLLTNISLIVATLGVLSVLPRIYARSNTAPGARKQNQQLDNKQNTENVSFKGKCNDKNGIFAKIGNKITKKMNDFTASELEYNGHNFTNTLMAGLSVFGLVTPRGIRAYNRAEVKKDGKKDLTELWEIIIRDVISSLSVVFAVPILSKACISLYEDKSGFVLMNKPQNQTGLKKFLNVINPYSSTQILSNSDIKALYEGVDSQAKMLNFCKHIDKNGGDLAKILSKSENRDVIFNDSTFKLDSISSLSKKEKNNKIIDLVKNADKKLVKSGKNACSKEVDGMFAKVMQGVDKSKFGSISKFARNLNSIPGALVTLVVSPLLLGLVIPKAAYKNTRRIHAKEERIEKEQNSQLKMRA